MAPTGDSKKPRGARHKSNTLHKKRREQRSLPKTNKKTAKNRIRDMDRRLRKLKSLDVDPAQVAALEAELAALRESETGAAESRRNVETEKRYAERYRKIKFFERQKVTRRLKQLRKELAAAPSDDLRARERALEDDLRYIKHYPKDRKYVSLFGGRAQDDRTRKLRADMRERALANARAAEQAKAARDSDDSDSDDADSDADSDDSSSSSGDSDGDDAAAAEADFFVAA